MEHFVFTFFWGIFCGVMLGFWVKVEIDRHDPYFEKKQWEKREVQRQKEATHD